MDNVKHLIEVLKSQVSLYSEFLDIIALEKQSVISWAVDETVRISKVKDTLLRREKIQEEARNALISKLATTYNQDAVTLAELISLVADDADREQLSILRDKLISLVTRLHAENLSLRMLYTTNNRLITEFFNSISNNEPAVYGPQGHSRNASTFRSVVG